MKKAAFPVLAAFVAGVFCGAGLVGIHEGVSAWAVLRFVVVVGGFAGIAHMIAAFDRAQNKEGERRSR